MQAMPIDSAEFQTLMNQARILLNMMNRMLPVQQAAIMACGLGIAAAKQLYPETDSESFARLMSELMGQAQAQQHEAMTAKQKAPDDGGDPAKAPTVGYGGRA